MNELNANIFGQLPSPSSPVQSQVDDGPARGPAPRGLPRAARCDAWGTGVAGEDISLGWLLVAVGGYPVVNIEKTMENHYVYPILMGKSTVTNYINYGKSPCYYWVNQP